VDDDDAAEADDDDDAVDDDDAGEMHDDDEVDAQGNAMVMDPMVMAWDEDSAVSQADDHYIDVSRLFELNLTETPEYAAAYATYTAPLDIKDIADELKVKKRALLPAAETSAWRGLEGVRAVAEIAWAYSLQCNIHRCRALLPLPALVSAGRVLLSDE
jgi:hypothetical protein